MFDSSKIDHSKLASGKPTINYNTSNLEKERFKLKYALDPRNPVYNQVIDECKSKNIPYRIIPGENNQKHIWIKEENN